MNFNGFWASCLLGLVLPVLGGCQNTPPENKTPEQTCPDLAKAACKKLAECEAGLSAYLFPDTASCEAYFAADCKTQATASGSKWTGDAIASCATTVSGVSCYDYWTAVKPLTADTTLLCSLPAGTVATGGACGTSSQCQGALCSTVTAGCGKCATRGQAGASCDSVFNCDKGLDCAGTSPRQCTLFLTQNQACNTETDGSSVHCHPTLACINGKCVTPAKLNETCRPGKADCEAWLICSAAGKCEQDLPSLGQPCNFACKAPGYCDMGTKKCVARAAAGAACGAPNPTVCTTGYDCINGKCGQYDPNVCK